MAPPSDELDFYSKIFLRAFPLYLRVDVSCTQYTEAEPHRFLDFLREQLGTLAAQYSADPAPNMLQLWWSLFVFSEAESKLSREVKQDRGTFLIGIDGHLDIFRFQPQLDAFVRRIKSSSVFQDERVPPSISAVLVDRSKLGKLVVDRIIWPQPKDAIPFLLAEIPAGCDAATAFLEAVDADDTINGAIPDWTPPVPVQKLRPASDVLNRLRWDAAHGAENYTVIYLDRFTGYQEVPVDRWRNESTEEDFVPQHRITAFRNKLTGQIIWHREERLDLVFRGS